MNRFPLQSFCEERITVHCFNISQSNKSRMLLWCCPIMHTSLQWLRNEINQSFQLTTDTWYFTPRDKLYAVFMKILQKNECIKRVMHYKRFYHCLYKITLNKILIAICNASQQNNRLNQQNMLWDHPYFLVVMIDNNPRTAHMACDLLCFVWYWSVLPIHFRVISLSLG